MSLDRHTRIALARRNRLSALLDWLRPLAKPVADQAEYSRWINAHNADPDQAADWCTPCACAEVERLNAAHPESEHFVDGGWGTMADTPPMCCKCFMSLDDHLTDAGIEYELEHYERNRVRLAGPGRAEIAFRLAQMLESGSFDEREPRLWAFVVRLDRHRQRAAATQPDGGAS